MDLCPDIEVQVVADSRLLDLRGAAGYVVALQETASLPKVVHFCRWLRAEAAATMSAAPSLRPTSGILASTIAER
jgi:hypothetical protein